MIPGRYDITLYQGDDFDLTIRLRNTNADGTPGAYKDLTGWTGKGDIKASVASSTLASFTVVVDADQTLTGNRGVVHLSLPNATTAGLTPTVDPASYVYDLQMTDTASKKRTYMAGTVKVIAEVTKP